MIKKVYLMAIVAIGLITVSCNNGNDAPIISDLTLDLMGLDDLGGNYVYEGWIIVNGSPVSTGTFSSVNFPQSFTVNTSDLNLATKFVLTIEPASDTNPAPSATKILVGDFNGNSANLSTAVVGDFSNIMGKYILATPTDGAMTNENSGIWFLNLPPPPTAGLTLPTLPSGWKYEGWVVVNGMPLTSGKFTKVAATDEFNGFSGVMGLPAVNGADGFFPGEDYLTNAPSGMTFPLDLSGGKAVISIEPDPDNSPMPFTLKPLVGVIPNPATDHTVYTMNANLGSFPSGTVTR